jgi:hypothetical protein
MDTGNPVVDVIVGLFELVVWAMAEIVLAIFPSAR